MNKNWQEYPIYISGNAKSGTTLLACLIDNHPEIFCIPKEVPFKPLGELLKPGDISPQNPPMLLDQLDRYVETTYAKLKPFTPEETTRNLAAFKSLIAARQNPLDLPDVYRTITESLVEAYGFQNQPFIKWSFKNVGKKTYHQFLDTYPHGKIVHIRRNPYGWILSRITSLQKKKRKVSQFSLLFIYRALRDWQRFENYADAAQKKYGPERFMIIAYEDLVAQPGQTLDSVWKFLGVSAAGSDLKPMVFKRPTSPDTARTSESAIYTEAVNDWQKQLMPHVKMAVSVMAGDFAKPAKA